MWFGLPGIITGGTRYLIPGPESGCYHRPKSGGNGCKSKYDIDYGKEYGQSPNAHSSNKIGPYSQYGNQQNPTDTFYID
jgi:hypothetical protein